MKRSRPIDEKQGSASSAAPSPPAPSATAGQAPAASASLTEHLAACLSALQQATASRAGLTLQNLLEAAGVHQTNSTSAIDLIGALQSNTKVEVKGDRYFYRTKYDARDKFELERLISSLGDSPLLLSDLADLYPGASSHLDDMTRTGAVVRVRSVDRQMPDAVYSRDQVESSRIRLSGTVSVTAGSCLVSTTSDLGQELFRNDVCLIVQGGSYIAARVSSEPDKSSKKAHSGAPGASAAGHEDDEDDIPPLTSAALTPQGAAQPHSQLALVAAALLQRQSSTAAVAPPQPISAPIAEAAPPAPSYPSTGVYRASIANAVTATGGMYSAGDTAPHVLRQPQTYAHPLTSTQIVLDRPWPGSSGTGLLAYRLGAPGDLRVLWREVVTHGQVQVSQGAGTAAAAAAAGTVAVVEGESLGEGATLLHSLGGMKAFKSLPAFPSSHREVRAEMAKVGMITKMLPGTLDVAVGVFNTAGKRGKRVRTLDRRVLNLTTASHLTGATLEAVKEAQKEVVRKQLMAKQAEASRQGNRATGSFGGMPLR